MNYEQKNYGKIGSKSIDKTCYIEELSPSDCFLYQKTFFVLTQDYRKNSSRLAISLIDGCTRWFSADITVDRIELYTSNEDGHLVAIKNEKIITQD
jgi:hypothetical protein